MKYRESSWVPIIALGLLLVGAACFLLAARTASGSVSRARVFNVLAEPNRLETLTYAGRRIDRYVSLRRGTFF